MSLHELMTSLFWLVLLGYAIYLVWFVRRWFADRNGHS